MKPKSIAQCLVKCVSGTHVPIILSNLEPVTLGRSPETKIKDKRCSKQQVELTANCEEFKVSYKHLGTNPGGLKEHLTKTGEKYELFHGDTFEFLKGQYPHTITFDPEPIPREPQSLEDASNSESKSAMPKKSTLQKPKRQRPETSDESDSKRICSSSKENEWESFYDNNLLVYNRSGLKSEKVASYDMDGTLITTISGRVFAKDINDWKIIFPHVPGKLKQLCSDGYKIVLFTNQAGVSKGKITVNQIQSKIGSIIKKLGVPAQALVSTGSGKYRKPFTGMWDFFIQECNGGLDVDLESSVYVGDAAGRPEIKKQRKKDHSLADRLFASNVGIPFFTPEEHFLGRPTEEYKPPEFIPSEINSEAPLYNPTSTKVPKYPVEVILLVGFPGSGKSTFAEKNLLKHGFIHANRDTMGTWQKCVAAMEQAIKDGKHVVIDNTNPDLESRKRFISVAKKHNVPIRCFLMDISLQQAKHNNKFRELSGSEHSKVNDMIYNMYKSKYVEPSKGEGFSDLVRVNFVPSFKSDEMEQIYKKFLLES